MRPIGRCVCNSRPRGGRKRRMANARNSYSDQCNTKKKKSAPNTESRTGLHADQVKKYRGAKVKDLEVADCTQMATTGEEVHLFYQGLKLWGTNER